MLLADVRFTRPDSAQWGDAAVCGSGARTTISVVADLLVVVEAERDATSDDRAGEEKGGQRDADGAHRVTLQGESLLLQGAHKPFVHTLLAHSTFWLQESFVPFTQVI
jgi:hypothetical protein